MVTFKTKDGKTVSFTPKTGKKKSKRSRGRKRRANPAPSQSRARPRTPRRHTMAKRRRSSHRGSSSTSGLTQVLLGGAVAGFLGSLIPYGNYGKLGVALVAHKQGGIIGNTAKALGVIGAANLVSGTGMTAATTAQAASNF
jgi:hypothetical protein